MPTVGQTELQAYILEELLGIDTNFVFLVQDPKAKSDTHTTVTLANMEDSLGHMRIAYAVWAVSPAIESTWPADEALLSAGKLVGFQFKRPGVKKGAAPPYNYSDVHWSLRSPPGQMHKVIKFPEIYYALPVFLNRNFRRSALQGCAFWRPNPGHTVRTVWFDNPKATCSIGSCGTVYSWCAFLAGLLRCTVGTKVTSSKEARERIWELGLIRLGGHIAKGEASVRYV